MASLYSSARSSLTALVYRNIESENVDGVEVMVFSGSKVGKGVATMVACSLITVARSFSIGALQETTVSMNSAKGLISFNNMWVFTFIAHMINTDVAV